METTQTGVSAPSVSAPVMAEAQFQSLFDSGAFDPQGKPPTVEEGATPKDTQATTEAPEAVPASNTDPEPQQTEAQPAPEAEQEESYSSFDDLIKAKGIDPESVRALPVTVKIDGVEKQVPLAEVLKSYQLEGHVNNKSIELSNAQKQFQAEQEAARGLIAQQLNQNKALGDLAQQQLNYEFQQVDWNALRQSDPARYAALYTDFQARQAQIQGYLGQLQQQQSAAEQSRQAEQAKLQQAEQALMLEKHPEWKDRAVFSTAQKSMIEYAKSLGYTDAELSQVVDHRIMSVLHDAASFRALQAAKPETLKRVREAPRVAQPGTRQNTDPKQANRVAAIERFNANPRDVSAQEALFSILAQ